MFIYISSQGSSLIGLPFPPSFVVYCFCSRNVRSDLIYIDVCSILLPTMRLEIFCPLLLLIVVVDGRALVSATSSFIAGLREGRTSF